METNIPSLVSRLHPSPPQLVSCFACIAEYTRSTLSDVLCLASLAAQKSSLARLKPQITAPKSAFKLCNLSTAKSNTGSSLGSDHRTTDWSLRRRLLSAPYTVCLDGTVDR